MSDAPKKETRPEGAPLSDSELLEGHEKILDQRHHADDRAHYRLLPLGMLLVLSACVLFAATYLNRYSGHFDPAIYDENLLPSKSAPAEVKVDPVVLGKHLFMSGGACFTCHQPNGEGIPGAYPPLAGSEWANGTPDRVVRIVLDGLQGPVHVEGKTFGAAVMPAFGPSGFNWSNEQISAVLSFVRQEWGNKSPAITADQVAKIRGETADHKAWSEGELLQIK